MIIVCDADVSCRAIHVRDTLLDIGYPTCISSIRDIKDNQPFCLIITFADVFNELRRTPFDDTFVIAIGDGFVNTALNAVQTKNLNTAVRLAHNFVQGSCHDKFGKSNLEGMFVPPFYFADGFFEIHSNLVAPTKSEYMIFKFLVFCSYNNTFASTDKICNYCFGGNVGDSNTIAAHISGLNSKIKDAYGKKIIKSKRFKGYYLEIT